jgi:hypothetical protein
MANPTSNFNWQMPTPTDLVTDLPADFEVFGQAVDSSMADLLGGTTGQILAKNSNTNMDFVWIANDQGDITGITATSPLTGGGTSGAVTVGIQDATTAQKGAVQLENSFSSTSTTTAAVPASVKSAYDLANAAIPKSLVDAAGDLIYATADNTPARLAIGTAGQVLKVNSGATAPEWGAASGASFVGCSVYKVTTDQTLSNDTNTVITFNAEEFDTDGFHDNSTNNSRITIPSGKGGKYLIISTISFAANATGQRATNFQINGTTNIILSFQYQTTSAITFRGTASGIANLTAGDYIECIAAQTSGGNLAVLAGQTQARFGVIYLGA